MREEHGYSVPGQVARKRAADRQRDALPILRLRFELASSGSSSGV